MPILSNSARWSPRRKRIFLFCGAESRSQEEPEVSADRVPPGAAVIREQRLRIKTLQSVHRDALSDLQREHRLEMQALRSDTAELQQKYERQKLSNEQLKKRLSERNEQYLAMQEQMASFGEGPEMQREDSTADAEVVLLREQLERRQRELELRDEKIVALEQENHELRNQPPTGRFRPGSPAKPFGLPGGLSPRRRSYYPALR